MAHILVADDEPQLIDLVRTALATDGHTLDGALDGQQALKLLTRRPFDLAVLDILMPDMDGIQLCAQIRQEPSLARLPVLMLTARAAIADRVKGFEAGCDDYLIKPFSLTELRLRIKALLRRAQAAEQKASQPEQTMIRIDETKLVLKPATFQVQVDDTAIELTPTETKLLSYLFQHHDQILSSRDLLENVWSYPEGVGNTGLVRTHMKNLRAKIEPSPEEPRIIRTEPHRGYVIQTNC